MKGTVGVVQRRAAWAVVAVFVLACQVAIANDEDDDDREHKPDVDVYGIHRDKLGMDKHIVEPENTPPCFERDRAFRRLFGDLIRNPPLREGQECIVKIEHEHGVIREADFSDCPEAATGPIGKILFERQPFPVSDRDECFDDDLEFVFRGQPK